MWTETTNCLLCLSRKSREYIWSEPFIYNIMQLLYLYMHHMHRHINAMLYHNKCINTASFKILLFSIRNIVSGGSICIYAYINQCIMYIHVQTLLKKKKEKKNTHAFCFHFNLLLFKWSFPVQKNRKMIRIFPTFACQFHTLDNSLAISAECYNYIVYERIIWIFYTPSICLAASKHSTWKNVSAKALHSQYQNETNLPDTATYLYLLVTEKLSYIKRKRVIILCQHHNK